MIGRLNSYFTVILFYSYCDIKLTTKVEQGYGRHKIY